jgi:long-chain acyl-CoA synthetase
VRPGNRVGLLLPNVPEFGVAYYGVLRAGAVVVAMDPGLPGREIASQLEEARARLLLAWHGCAEKGEAAARAGGADSLFVTPGEFDHLLNGATPVRDPVARDEDDVAVILAESGAALTHVALASAIASAVAAHGAGRSTVTLGALALSGSVGQTCSLNATVRAGGCVTLLPRFEASRALAVMQRDGVTAFHGEPAMYAALLAHPDRGAFDVSTLELGVSGGALLADVVQRFEHAFGCRVLDGMTGPAEVARQVTT